MVLIHSEAFEEDDLQAAVDEIGCIARGEQQGHDSRYEVLRNVKTGVSAVGVALRYMGTYGFH